MRTIGAKNKPKTFNVTLGQLKKILNFESDDTVLEVSVKYLPLLGIEPTQIITSASVIHVGQNESKIEQVEVAKPVDLSNLE